MARKSLTDLGVENLRPRAARYAYPDPELRGHYVRVSPRGSKSYAVVTLNKQRKQLWVTLGTADVMKIEEARERARRVLQRVRDGLPPVEEEAAQPLTFQEVAENWIKRHVAAKELRSAPEVERCLKVYVYPEWPGRSFVGIRRSDISALLDKIEDERGPRQADIVLGILRGICNWFAARHEDYINPIVKGMKRQGQVKRDRILSDEEIRAVWRHAEKAGVFGAIIRFALLTAQRREKVATLKWADLKGDVWTIPGEERGKGTGGTLKLPPEAMAIVKERPRIVGNPYVFAGRGDNAFNGFSKSKATFDAGLPKVKGADGIESEIPNWTLHDLRRTARSLLSRAGVRPDISERVMGHVIPGVEGIYDRHSYDDEKGEALKLLSALIFNVILCA